MHTVYCIDGRGSLLVGWFASLIDEVLQIKCYLVSSQRIVWQTLYHDKPYKYGSTCLKTALSFVESRACCDEILLVPV